ncbi:hypothetical protein M422DRAFT_256280 [Sphaerobolus stellatus SS14]|uniref:Uncharacterized protein n=1 Tax=Sphaerobolus stellatus (strain SS14) TaxID=990650 RepID=A0A0C9VHE9_SPHS4|nr:hypothetical protein M422DRAFT_256280 [Sphaerobolus stellatus SS14]
MYSFSVLYLLSSILSLASAASLPVSPQTALPCATSQLQTCFAAIVDTFGYQALSMDRCQLSEIDTSPDAWIAQPIAHEECLRHLVQMGLNAPDECTPCLTPLSDNTSPLGNSSPLDAGSHNPVGGVTGGSNPFGALNGITGRALNPIGELGGLAGGSDPLGELGGGDVLNGLTGAAPLGDLTGLLGPL